ncbi:MAG: hypothetical protein VYC82_03280 [Verrucomicrobiota bacterium]|nr:hypothetical protein [Verrucomicrobiota bacterium]
MQLKARAVGIEAEDYLNDKAPEEPDYQSYRKLVVRKYDLQRFAPEGEFELDDSLTEGLEINDYVLLVSEECRTMPARLLCSHLLRKLAVPDPWRHIH